MRPPPRLRRLIEIGLADPESATGVAERAQQPRADLRLLGPRGEVLGEIERVADAVVVEIGPWVNALGFLDLGAQEKEVPAEQILFGQRAAVWLEPDPDLVRWRKPPVRLGESDHMTTSRTIA